MPVTRGVKISSATKRCANSIEDSGIALLRVNRVFEASFRQDKVAGRNVGQRKLRPAGRVPRVELDGFPERFLGQVVITTIDSDQRRQVVSPCHLRVLLERLLTNFSSKPPVARLQRSEAALNEALDFALRFAVTLSRSSTRSAGLPSGDDSGRSRKAE